MRHLKKWMLAAILTCGTMTMFNSCVTETDNPAPTNPEDDWEFKLNKAITDGNYDKSLAVKCINGTFVGQKTDNVISYLGIPFVGQQPVGSLRWKAPVEYTPSDGIFEAYYYGKTPFQAEGDPSALYIQGEDCLYLNVWKADEATTEKKPVMVWIYGGAVESGRKIEQQ